MSFWRKIIRSGKSLKPEFARKTEESQSHDAVDTATINKTGFDASVDSASIDASTINFAPEPEDEAPPMPPARFELVDGSLFAGINLHEVNLGTTHFSCWSYLSDGLGKYGQKEMSFLIKINDDQEDDQYPLAPLGFLYTVKDYASKGQLVDDWDITEFGNTGFIAPHFKAVAYLPPEPISVFESTGKIVTGIPITEDELTVAKTYGLTRLLGLLGQAFSHFPCPPWVDLQRQSVVTPVMLQAMQQSIVAKLPHLRVPGVSVALTDNDIVLRMKPIARGFIEQQLRQVPDSFPIVLRAELDRQANGLLVWQSANDQQAPSAITPPGSDGSRIAGAFIIFIPEQDETEGQVLEDGYVVRLRNEVWQTLRKHMFDGGNIKILADTPGMNLALEWVVQDYENPVDGKTYHSAEGWKTVQPQNPRIEMSAIPSVKVKHVVLLSTEAEFQNSITPQMLSNFAGLIETVVVQFFSRKPRPCPELVEFIVQCKILPQKKVEWMLSAMPESEGDKDTLIQLQTELDSLSVPNVTGDAISFQVVFSLK